MPDSPNNSANTNSLPEYIAHYRILRRLGKGGMGEVLLAEDTNQHGRKVALKGLTTGTHSIREPPAPVQTGSTRDPRTQSSDETLGVVIQIAMALEAAHAEGIVHRDIKPENILVDRLGRVKVADFGLAKLIASEPSAVSPADPSVSSPSAVATKLDLTEAGKVMGTPRYMAPEQRAHPDTVDHRADIYALGVVLYQMLTGELPDANQLRPPSHRVQLDVRLDEVVLRALASEPSRRYAQARAMKPAVESVASSAPSTSERSPAPARSVSKGRPLRWAVPTVAALVIIVFTLFLSRGWLAPPSRQTVESPPAEKSSPAARPAVSDPEREILRLNLERARRALEMAKARYDAGLAGSTELHDAKDEVTILEASLRGDAPAIARLKLTAAERRLDFAKRRSQLRTAHDTELHDAEDELALLRATLEGDPVAIAGVKLAAAERRLDRAKRRRSTGVATELDVDNAQTEVAVLKLQLEAAKTGSK